MTAAASHQATAVPGRPRPILPSPRGWTPASLLLAGVPSYASRSATKQYRTAPLRGIWQRALGLTGPQKADLVQYLKSL